MVRSFLSALLALLLITTPAYAKDRTELASKLRASTRQAFLYENGEIAGYCTAFSINDAKDYFLTAAHCVDGVDYIAVSTWNAYVIYVNPDADLAVLVVPDSGDVPALHLATEVAQGQELFNYGYGQGFSEPMFRAGYCSIVDIAPFEKPMPQLHVGSDEHFTVTDFAIVPGQSGGPIVNADGNIVTINQLGDGTIGLGRVLSELYKYVGKYWEK